MLSLREAGRGGCAVGVLVGGEQAVGHRDEQVGEWKACVSKGGKGDEEGSRLCLGTCIAEKHTWIKGLV